MAELTEPPSYFNREVRQSYQMSFRELEQYIAAMRQAGAPSATPPRGKTMPP